MIEEYPNLVLSENELSSLIKIWQVMIEKQYLGGAVINKTILNDRALGAVEIFQIFKAALKTNEQL